MPGVYKCNGQTIVNMNSIVFVDFEVLPQKIVFLMFALK